jgi:hypothetical protein
MFSPKDMSGIKKSKKHFSVKKDIVLAIATFMLLIGLPLLVITSSQITNFFSQAAGSSAVEAENGTRSGTVTEVVDANASGGKYIKFNNTSPSNTFVHPGVLVSKPQLDFVKAKIAANQQPWKGEYDRMVGSIPGRTTHTPSPVPVLKCSTDPTRAASFGFPIAGCTEMIADSDAAYTQALLWYYTGNPAYAVTAKNILNAWANTMTGIAFDQPRYPDTNGQVFANGQLYGGWGGTKMLRAAEILRYTYSGWTQADTELQENHFKTVYYPLMKDGWTGGQNRTTVMNETALYISIFANDRTMYNYVLPQVRHSTKSLMYMSRDGAQPLYPIYKGVLNYVDSPAELKSVWSNPNSYINGLEQESCRDLGHALMGMSSLSNMAETARIQGDDIYGEEQDRFVAAYELNAGYVLEYLGQTNNLFNRAVPTGWMPTTNWVCPTFAATAGGGSAALGWEIAYNHYKTRQGIAMPNTEQLINRIRAMSGTSTRSGNHIGWETATHAGTP